MLKISLDELDSINNENMILSDSRKRIKKLSSITQGEIFYILCGQWPSDFGECFVIFYEVL